MEAENRIESFEQLAGLSFARGLQLPHHAAKPQILTNKLGVNVHLVEIVPKLLEDLNLFACILTSSHRPPITHTIPI